MKDLLEQLKTERLRRGWTLQDLSDRTRITITVLKTLESGKTEDLGSPFNVETLVRKYSTALGAEAEQTADLPPKTGSAFRHIISALLLIAVFAVVFFWPAFRQTSDTGKSSLKPPVPAAKQAKTVPAVTPERKSLPVEKSVRSRHKETPETGKRASGSLLDNETAGSISAPKENTVLPGESSAAPASPANRPVAVASNRPAAPVRAGHSLEMEANQRTWIQVIIDGKKSDTELLQPGEVRKWKAMKKAYLVVGNGGGVRVKWDGKPVEIASDPGRVIRLTLPQKPWSP